MASSNGCLSSTCPLKGCKINPGLTKALNTREGLLLKQWMYAPGVVHTLFPQADAKETDGLLMQKPVPLLATQSVTPLLDEKGQPEAAWLGFLNNDTAGLELDPGSAELGSGICPLLLEAKTADGEASTPLLGDLIQLHGLFETLATYQEQLHICWELAGFGGDNCVYDQLADGVTSILQELCAFNAVLSQRLEHFQERLDLLYKTALEATSHLGWRTNYQTAKASQEKLICMLQGCNTALTRIMQHAQNKEARVLRRSTAVKAHAKLQSAPRFLNKARERIGLAPKAYYPGLGELNAQSTAFTDNPFGLAIAADDISLDQVLVALFPNATASSVWLSRVSAETPTTQPWKIFHGSSQRYHYLHNNTRLQEIGRDFMYLTLHAQMPMTPEKAEFIKKLRQQLQQEQARIKKLSANLWWPFHRTSKRFFATWQAGITEKLNALSIMARETSTAGISTQALQRALLPAERQGLIAEPLSTEDQQRLGRIYQSYSELSIEKRAHFDAWQCTQFGGLVWDVQGALRLGLTKHDVVLITMEWAKCVVQYGEEVVANFDVTMAAHQASQQRADTYLNANPIPVQFNR